MNFEKWLSKVDNLCQDEYMVSIHDLPDMEFYDAWECEMTPEEFFEENLDLEALQDLIYG